MTKNIGPELKLPLEQYIGRTTDINVPSIPPKLHAGARVIGITDEGDIEAQLPEEAGGGIITLAPLTTFFLNLT